MMYFLNCIYLLSFLSTVLGLGLIIEPTLAGDFKKYSSINNVQNCVSYQTVKDDLILVRIKSGDKFVSQSLNLNIFDLDNNKIRVRDDISKELNFMFTNLNNPQGVNSELAELQVIEPRANLLNRLSNFGGDSNNNKDLEVDETELRILSNKGKSLVYICFDNLYTDRSWSFNPQAREVELFIDIKNMTTIKDTNYNNFARYFSKLQDASTESTGNKETDSSFTESDFEASVKRLEDELNHVIENLKISESISHQLMEQEFGLRDVNEAIYEGYTMISCIMLACIVFFGIFQLSYQRWYLKRKNVI